MSLLKILILGLQLLPEVFIFCLLAGESLYQVTNLYLKKCINNKIHLSQNT